MFCKSREDTTSSWRITEPAATSPWLKKQTSQEMCTHPVSTTGAQCYRRGPMATLRGPPRGRLTRYVPSRPELLILLLDPQGGSSTALRKNLGIQKLSSG
jgi:hypothetical protein